ncbi:MAG: hypothetical protein KDA89_09285, partial [Planctomycetaceae bacterium]|nr:hypothetical protein [Planctomycetaceae bacterium]
MGDAAIEALSQFENLNALSLRHVQVSRTGLDVLEGKPIKALTIREAPDCNDLILKMPTWEFLAQLWIRNEALSDEAMASLARFPHLNAWRIEVATGLSPDAWNVL